MGIADGSTTTARLGRESISRYLWLFSYMSEEERARDRGKEQGAYFVKASRRPRSILSPTKPGPGPGHRGATARGPSPSPPPLPSCASHPRIQPATP